MISLGDIYSNTESGSVVTLTSTYDDVILRIYDDYSTRLDEIVNVDSLGERIIETKYVEASLLAAFIEIINYYYRDTDSSDTNFFTEDEKDDVLQHINNLLESTHRIDEGSASASVTIGIPCYSGTLVGVTSIFGRTGSIVAASGDYEASLVGYDNDTSGLTATNVQSAIDELATSVGTSSIWGNITGTLANQTDLQNALDLKQNIITDSDDITEGSINLFFTVAEQSKLLGIEAGAEVNPTASEIKTLYESNANTNAFSDVYLNKLTGIEAGAEVNNISDANASLLTGGSAISLHTHSYLSLTDTPTIPSSHTELSDIGSYTHSNIDDHIDAVDNPHSVTSTQVGLGNVDNTADLDKPISTATQTALDGKVNLNAVETIYGAKTFAAFPITPSSVPSSDYQVANKLYVDSFIIPDSSKIIYVNADSGVDTNDGLTIQSPKLTLNSAVSAASSLSPSSSNPVAISIEGDFTENITLPSYTHLYGPHSILTSEITITTGSVIKLYKLIAPTATTLTSNGTDNIADIDYIDGRVYIAQDLTLNSKLISTVSDNNNIIYIYGASSIVNLHIDKISLAYNNCFGIVCANIVGTQKVNGYVGEIIDEGAGTTVGISSYYGLLNLSIGKIDTDTAYINQTNSTLNLFINSISGTETNSGIANISVAGASGGVLSFDGRTGAVVPTTNDYTWAQIDKTTSDIADITTKSHTSLTDIGTNTHAQIDTHLAASNPHSGSAASGANTDITSILNAALYVGRDTDNRLNWTTDDQLDIVIGGTTSSILSVSTGTSNNDKLVTQGYVDDAITAGGGYTDENAQDAVGGILSNEFTYDDVTPSISLNYTNISHTDLQDIGTNTHAQVDTHIASTSNPHSVTAAQASAVALTGNETVAGIKTFSSFPITPSSSPTTDYQVANKAYVDSIASSGIPVSLKSIYVSATYGNDSNSGLSVAVPKLTIASALTAAAGLSPTSGAPVTIYLDGHFTENVTLSDYINLIGPGTIINGIVTASDNIIILDSIISSSGDGLVINNSTKLYVDIRNISASIHAIELGSSVSGHIKVDTLDIEASQQGIYNNLDNLDVYLDIGKINLNGNSAQGIYITSANPNKKISGKIGDIVNTGAYTLTTGITAFEGVLDLNINKIDANTAYNIGASAELNMFINDITGSELGAGTINVTVAGVSSGAVDSVFGRTGTVTAQTNDYTWVQIDKTVSDIADITTKSHTSLTDIGSNTHVQIDSHISNTSNPHSVTAAQVGAITELSDDTTPQLGGNLDISTFNIEGADAADFLKLSSITASATELNYTDGVLAPIQGQLNNRVETTGNETIAGVKTFSSFPVTPSEAPASDYQVANKKYIDDAVLGAGAVTSVFGRAGVVTAQSNDYTWAQIDKTTSSIADITTKNHSDLSGVGTNTHTQIDSHISSSANPHSVTATQLGCPTLSGIHTITGSYTFNNVNPPTIANLPSVSSHAANKAYVDAQVATAGGINNVVEDTTPQLGGNLDIQTFNIEGADAADFVKLAAITSSATELNYVDGVTSNIQTQIDALSSSGSQYAIQVSNGSGEFSSNSTFSYDVANTLNIYGPITGDTSILLNPSNGSTTVAATSTYTRFNNKVDIQDFISLPVHSGALSDIPTTSELNTATGTTPVTAGDGAVYLVRDTGGTYGGYIYLVIANTSISNWMYTRMNVAV